MKFIFSIGLILAFFSSGAQKNAVPVIDAGKIAVPDLLWDVQALSKAPTFEWLTTSGSAHSLKYKSVPFEGRPTEVFAWYSNPDIVNGRPPGKQRYPGVVLIHGGGGKAFREWVEKWAAEGYAAIAMDLAGKDAEGNRLPLGGPDQKDEDKFARIEKGELKNVWTYHAVASAVLAHSFLLGRPEVAASKTQVTGISWGGYLTCIVGSLDNRFKAAAPVYGCGYYDESDVFRQAIGRLTPDARVQWMRYFDPSVYLPSAQPRFFFLNGNKDSHYNVVPYHKTYSLVPAARRTVCIKPDMPHSHEAGWAPHEIRYFFESITGTNTPLPKVGVVVQKDSLLSVTYESPVGNASAVFFYTSDIQTPNVKRSWASQPARYDPETRTFSSPVPEGGFRYGFFSIRDQRNVMISSELTIR